MILELKRILLSKSTFARVCFQIRCLTLSLKSNLFAEYKVQLKAPEQPVVNCGNKANAQYIPSELCYVLGGQPARRVLSSNQTANMIRFAARVPNLNAASIENSGLEV